MEDRPRAKVILFKPSGKYYTEEDWRIPTLEEAEKHPKSEFRLVRGDMTVP